MDYIAYLKVIATLKEIGLVLLKIVKWIIVKIVRLCFNIIYIISTVGFFIFGFMLLPGIYFGITVVIEMVNGAGFFETLNWGMFLFCFGFPSTLGVIRTLTNPSK